MMLFATQRKITTFLVLALICGLALAPAKLTSAQTEFRIGMVTDIGFVDDRSFNQSAWEGAQLAADALGGFSDVIETVDPSDYATNLQQFADQDFNVIVTTGAAIGDAVIKAAQQYPKTHFIAVDVDIERLLVADKLSLTNVTGLVFPGDQAGYLSGALAAHITKRGIIAAVLPTDQLQPVVDFKEGFEAGARHVKPDIKIISTYHPGGLAVAFDDPSWGAVTAGQAIDQGADVIFSGGGKTGNGGLQEVARRTTEADPLFCIGVDTDQWFTVPEAQNCLITSGMKMIREGVDQLVRLVADDKAPGGNFVGEVGLAPFHDFEGVVPETVTKELDQIRADLKSGKLKTGVNVPSEGATAEPTAEATAAN